MAVGSICLSSLSLLGHSSDPSAGSSQLSRQWDASAGVCTRGSCRRRPEGAGLLSSHSHAAGRHVRSTCMLSPLGAEISHNLGVLSALCTCPSVGSRHAAAGCSSPLSGHWPCKGHPCVLTHWPSLPGVAKYPGHSTAGQLGCLGVSQGKMPTTSPWCLGGQPVSRGCWEWKEHVTAKVDVQSKVL